MISKTISYILKVGNKAITETKEKVISFLRREMEYALDFELDSLEVKLRCYTNIKEIDEKFKMDFFYLC